MTGVMFTANRLDDGVVIWLTGSLCWSETASGAAVFSDADIDLARRQVAAASDRNEIVAAYEVAVDGRTDRSMRERIRAAGGPTIIPPQDRAVPLPQTSTRSSTRLSKGDG
ncbi:DUF2849 domain-containing protein [Alphaproteobacteria bacterium LSUCC0719]